METGAIICECLSCGHTMSTDGHCIDLCLSDKVNILLLDGREISIPQIIKELKQKKKLWVYSSKNTGEFLPQKIIKAQKTKFDKMLKITLDNNKSLECTYEHPIMLRNGDYKRADELKVNDSLMPFNTMISKKSRKNKFNVGGYRFFWDLIKNKWYPVHLWVVKSLNLHHLKGGVVHHKTFDKLNNNPDKLQILSHKEHQDIHVKHLKELMKDPKWVEKRKKASFAPKVIAKRIESQKKWWKSEEGQKYKEEELIPRTKKLWTNPDYIKKMKKISSDNARKRNASPTKAMKESRKIWREKGHEWIRNHRKEVSNWFSTSMNKVGKKQCPFCEKWIEGKHASYAVHVGHCLRKAGLHPKIEKRRNKKGQFLSKVNHKVIKIQKIKAKQGYDITIKGLSNFAINTGIFVHNSCPKCSGQMRRKSRPGIGR